ncbi:MAG: ribosomal protection-like ABC-F family protein [Flavobacteriaceae bacterium]
MLNVHNATVTFSGEDLFSGITFKLDRGDRVGLIGKNGAGKSTMLKVISKELPLDDGTLAFDKNATVGFLKQDLEFIGGRTVLEESYQAFEEIMKTEKELERINTELATRTDYESEYYANLMHELDEHSTRYEMLGGYNYQGTTERVLIGLGFKREDFGSLTETFSGGWRMRIELAKLLLQDNDVLLLDEPTNHLDIESIIWLEKFLRNYAGAIVLVSHDKMFLDQVTNRTIEISLGKIYDYKKPYSEFLLLRDEIRTQQLQAKKNQDREIKQAEQLIAKFRAKATKASMAQSMIKKLEKVDRIEVDQTDNAVMNIRFPLSIEPGKVVVTAESVEKSYEDKLVLDHVDIMIERGSRLAFVGQNGQGKSTLAKIIVGEIPYNGNLKLGHNVQLGYFAQNQAEYLDGEKTLLDTMLDAANDGNRVKVRDMLGSFLFSGDDVEKKVKVLSGGERNRLALCKMLLTPFNVLVLDEPTNHLDIASKTVLKEALKNFEGTLIVVSHDRDFLQGLSTKVIEFKDNKLKEYLGDINYFLEEHESQDMRAVELGKKKEASKPKNEDKKQAYEKSKGESKKLKQLRNKLSKVERSIADVEKHIEKEDQRLAEDPSLASDASYFEAYELKQQELEEYMTQWEKIEGEIDQMS